MNRLTIRALFINFYLTIFLLPNTSYAGGGFFNKTPSETTKIVNFLLTSSEGVRLAQQMLPQSLKDKPSSKEARRKLTNAINANPAIKSTLSTKMREVRKCTLAVQRALTNAALAGGGGGGGTKDTLDLKDFNPSALSLDGLFPEIQKVRSEVPIVAVNLNYSVKINSAHKIEITDLETNTPIKKKFSDEARQVLSFATAVKIHPDVDEVFVAGKNGIVYQVSLASGNVKRTLPLSAKGFNSFGMKPIEELNISEDGSQLIGKSGMDNLTWDITGKVATLKVARNLVKGEMAEEHSNDFSGANNRFHFSADKLRGIIKVYDAADNMFELSEFKTDLKIKDAKVHFSRDELFILDETGGLSHWNLVTSKLIQYLAKHEPGRTIKSFEISEDGHTVTAITKQGKLNWDIQNIPAIATHAYESSGRNLYFSHYQTDFDVRILKPDQSNHRHTGTKIIVTRYSKGSNGELENIRVPVDNALQAIPHPTKPHLYVLDLSGLVTVWNLEPNLVEGKSRIADQLFQVEYPIRTDQERPSFTQGVTEIGFNHDGHFLLGKHNQGYHVWSINKQGVKYVDEKLPGDLLFETELNPAIGLKKRP